VVRGKNADGSDPEKPECQPEKNDALEWVHPGPHASDAQVDIQSK
jgi:hypothetical protein